MRLLFAAVLISACSSAHGQIKRTSVPIGDAVSKALDKMSLTDDRARPFHIRVSISEPENSQSPYQGTIEEWWVSPTQWRREVTTPDGVRQTIVIVDGKKTEHDEGDYFPLWLRRFVTAVFDPVPDVAAWTAGSIFIEQVTLPNGAKSEACARVRSKLGSGERATDVFSNVCFDGEGRLKFIGSPRYSMEFRDYRGFHNKQVPRKLVAHPEPGTELVGELTLLEDEGKVKTSADFFTPLNTNDDRFRSLAIGSSQMEQLTTSNMPIVWPTVRSGDLRGRMALYISVDREGQVREVWPLNSDNAGLDDSARNQVRQWKLKPATDEGGNRVQVDGGLGFAFETKIENPLPVITGAEIEKVASGCGYNPTLPAGLLPSGASLKIRVSVNEAGKITGEGFPQGIPSAAIQKAGLQTMNCRFKPYLVNGKATYYHIDFVFTAP
jgi:TonB family protein